MNTIRKVTRADHERWKALFNEYASFYNTTTGPTTEATVWEWILDMNNPFWCDLAVDESGRIVGFVQYQLMHRSLSGNMVCYLSDLYVEPDVRGSGAGRQMIDHVFAFARSYGISNVRWLTQEYNYAGRKLYDSYAKKSDFILYSVPVE